MGDANLTVELGGTVDRTVVLVPLAPEDTDLAEECVAPFAFQRIDDNFTAAATEEVLVNGLVGVEREPL